MVLDFQIREFGIWDGPEGALNCLPIAVVVVGGCTVNPFVCGRGGERASNKAAGALSSRRGGFCDCFPGASARCAGRRLPPHPATPVVGGFGGDEVGN